MKVSKAEYARRRGVNRSRVTAWSQNGQIVVTKDGMVDVEKSDARLATRPKTYRGGKAKTVPGSNIQATFGEADDSPNTAQAVHVKETYLALLRQLEYDKQAGWVVTVDDVVKRVAAAFSVLRNSAIGLGAKLAPKLILCKTAEQMKQVVDTAIEQMLEEMTGYDGPLGDPSDLIAGRAQADEAAERAIRERFAQPI